MVERILPTKCLVISISYLNRQFQLLVYACIGGGGGGGEWEVRYHIADYAEKIKM